jgi:hypothetical protein
MCQVPVFKQEKEQSKYMLIQYNLFVVYELKIKINPLLQIL